MKPSIYKILLGLALALYSLTLLATIFIGLQISPAQLLGKSTSIAPAPAAQLPDFASFTNVKEKKEKFFTYLTPLVEAANENINQEREQLLKLNESWKANRTLRINQQKTLTALSRKYEVSLEDSVSKQIAELLIRADTLPVSLVLAQAANESAWGTSRFAKQGNNLFGQWCYRKGCGIVPSLRNKGTKHEVRKFSSPAESVASYCLNLNSHNAYQLLRNIRSQLKTHHHKVTGHALAGGLVNYSERKEEYVEELRSMIRSNRLE